MSSTAHDVAEPTGHEQRYCVAIQIHGDRHEIYYKQLKAACLAEGSKIRSGFSVLHSGLAGFVVFYRDRAEDTALLGERLTRSKAAKLIASELDPDKNGSATSESSTLRSVYQTLLVQHDFKVDAGATEGWELSKEGVIKATEGSFAFATDEQALNWVDSRAFEGSARHAEAYAFSTGTFKTVSDVKSA